MKVAVGKVVLPLLVDAGDCLLRLFQRFGDVSVEGSVYHLSANGRHLYVCPGKEFTLLVWRPRWERIDKAGILSELELERCVVYRGYFEAKREEVEVYSTVGVVASGYIASLSEMGRITGEVLETLGYEVRSIEFSRVTMNTELDEGTNFIVARAGEVYVFVINPEDIKIIREYASEFFESLRF